MMMKTALILTLVWHPAFGQQSNDLPGVASLFNGFSKLVAGPCKTEPDGCLDFFEGWYMHNGTSGTSNCQTTCIRYPSVRPELKCGMCDAIPADSKPPVASTVANPAPFFATIVTPLISPAPVDVSTSSFPSIAPSHYPTSRPSTTPLMSPQVSVIPSVATITVRPPVIAPSAGVPVQGMTPFEILFDKLPVIPSSELSTATTLFPSVGPSIKTVEPSEESLAELSADMSFSPSSIPSNVDSDVPSYILTSPDSFLV